MTFTSNFFLIGLLPFFLLAYSFIGGKRKMTLKMVLLALMNTVFYVFGGVKAFVFLLIFIVITYLFTILLYRYKNKLLFGLACIILCLPLLLFKYFAYILPSYMEAGTIFGSIAPLGISFFTFEAISLISDVYTGRFDHKIKLYQVFLYLSFFVTITSGPIIRMDDFEKGIRDNLGPNRSIVQENNNEINLKLEDGRDYYRFLERIMLGLIKKLLIADKIAPLADYYFSGVALGNSYSAIGLWIGSIAYTLQLFFDFSGYSDIAIGIGGLCGFDIPENFNAPYQARSIQDFWRRWHITLSRWFRDYIYIPLGGNRCSVPRHIFNMFVVWIITGAWHGSDLSFIVWGMGYFILLILEKYIPKLGKISNHWFGHLYALFFINLLWIPFRADTTLTAGRYIAGMFGFGDFTYNGLLGIFYVEKDTFRFFPVIIAAVLMCMPIKRWCKNILSKHNVAHNTQNIFKGIVMIILVFLTICAVINSSFAPYIYGGF